MREDEQGEAVLSHITRHGPATVARIATATGLDAAAVAEVLRLLALGGVVAADADAVGDPVYRDARRDPA